VLIGQDQIKQLVAD